MKREAERPPRPVCIVGMPRSGTTWVAKIFDSHPATLYRHEPDSGGVLDEVPVHAAAQASGTVADRMRSFLDELPRQRSLKTCGKLPLFAKDYLPGWRGRLHRGSVYAAKALAGWVRLPVLEPIDSARGAPVPVWKSIESTGRAGLIANADPDARVILVVRHPCGQIDSTLRGQSGRRFSDDYTAAEDWGIFEYLLETPQAQRRGLTMNHLRALTPEERLAWRWLLFNEKAMEELRGRANTYVLRYEDLCERPIGVARMLLMFAGLPWQQAVEDFVHDSTATTDDRYYSVYRHPERAAHAWRARMDPAMAERIASVVADTLPGKLYAQLPADASSHEA